MKLDNIHVASLKSFKSFLAIAKLFDRVHTRQTSRRRRCLLLKLFPYNREYGSNTPNLYVRIAFPNADHAHFFFGFFEKIFHSLEFHRYGMNMLFAHSESCWMLIIKLMLVEYLFALPS